MKGAFSKVRVLFEQNAIVRIKGRREGGGRKIRKSSWADGGR